MRLGAIYEIVSAELPILILDSAQNGNEYNVKNLNVLRESLQRISKIPSLSKQANAVLALMPYANKGETLSISIPNFQKIQTTFHQVVTRGNILLETLGEIVEKPEAGLVYLKLPQFENLHSLSIDIDLLETNFSQIFGTLDKNVNVKLKGFDVGTPWLVFSIATGSVSFFAATLIAAMKVAQEAMKTKIIFNQYEASEADADNKKKVDDAMNLLLDGVVNKEAKWLIEKYKNDPTAKDGDEAIRVATALRKLSSLFEKGADVQVPRITQNLIQKDIPKEEAEKLDFERSSAQLANGFTEVLKFPRQDEDK